MEHKLQFIVEEGAGEFIYPAARFRQAQDDFDALLEGHQTGQLRDTDYLTGLKMLIKREPDFIDAHAHLSLAFDELEDNPKKALKAALAGLAVGNRLIPEGFHGRIEWIHVANRPYLRALHSAAVSYIQLGRGKDGSLLMEKMLAYNPDDNVGVRYLLGSVQLRSGDIASAGEFFNAYADDYPPYYYELALFHLIQGDKMAAATALRKGFSTNIYIAEMLCGNVQPWRHAVWHDSNFAEPETAMAYMGMYGHLWFLVPERVEFVHWVFNHSSVMAERAAIAKCHEALLSERSVEARIRILSQRDTLRNAIDDTLSAYLFENK